MKNRIIVFVLFCSSFSFSQIKELQNNSDAAREKIFQKNRMDVPPNPTKYVNPFVGTGGHGHTFPGPVLPFGMVQVGPDSRYDGWDGCSGYHYSDTVIYGFSHTHLSGTGVSDYSDVLFVPQQGKLNKIPGYKNPKGFGSTFSHQNEKAEPGYYSVKLDNGIQVELTATKRCALHRYQFSNLKDKKYLVIDLGYRDKVLDVSAVKVSSASIQGKRISEAWAKKQYLFFHLETSIPFSKSKWIQDSKTGTYLFVLEFPKNTMDLSVKIGISGVDEQGAANNLKSEISDFDFQKIRNAASLEWNKELSSIQVKSKNQEQLSIFYTALYHAYIHPSLWSDVDGRFRDFNEQVKSADNEMYSVFSLWDTYRAAHPLFTITQQKRVRDFVESFMLQYKNTGILPVWPLSNNETNCMIGYHAVSVIVDAYLKGIPLGDPKKLLEAMIATSNANRFGIKDYVENGFISASQEAESVSKTLEYAYDDWCIALFAEKIGDAEIALKYHKRAASWLNLLHPESRFFQPRKNGIFLPFYKPNEVNHHYTEANGWQYALAAPQHVQSLIDVHGGNEGMQQFLDSLFFSSSEMTGREQVDITGLIGQYAHGNEPSHHMAYFYSYAGQPWKTQSMLDSIMKTFYSTKPDGLSGNEDAGQMSAWYILNSIGFYPVAPGSLTYAIGRPLFEEVKFQTNNVPFEVKTINNSAQNKYIQSITWKGQAYQKMYITHEMITEGGTLVITMGSEPNKELVTYELDLRQVIHPDFVPVPYFTNTQTIFEHQLEVNLDVLFFEKGKILYSKDGVKFLPFYTQGGAPILLNESTTIYAKVVRNNGAESQVVKTQFTKYVRDKHVELSTVYANQYAAAGGQSLVDGQRGSDEYRGTEWQGFQGNDVKGVIRLHETKEISTVLVSYLQDPRSWIFPPKSVSLEISLDGVSYQKIGKVSGPVLRPTDGLKTSEIQFDFVPSLAKYIRFSVENYGPCPEWHLGAGGSTWIFLDEIIVK